MQLSIDAINLNSSFNLAVNEIFHIRKQVFADRLKWKVQCKGNLEIDKFDNDNTSYLIVRNIGKIIATCRIIKTTNPTMLGEIFPQLLRGEFLYPDPAVHEISRLASVGGNSLPVGALPHVLHGLRDFADAHDVKEFVFATTTAIERMLYRLNLNLRRFGDGQPTDIDGVNSVALRLQADSILRIS